MRGGREEQGFEGWLRDFRAEAVRRERDGDPDWARGARLDRWMLRSLQRFQVGEDGDGANLTAKAAEAGDEVYAEAVRLFVAEERDHARMLAALLAAAGAPTIAGHWSDVVFVRLRRVLGLRLELMVLMVAEVVALRYYRAVRDGSRDRLASDVAGRILADELRHVPFHRDRLRESFRPLPGAVRVAARLAWWTLTLGACAVVVWDHGPALRRLGVTRTAFAADVTGLFATVTGEVFGAGGRPRRRGPVPPAGSHRVPVPRPGGLPGAP
ncbi:ferritin-like domain-containing protein [Streptosporangium sp. NPDC048047]|uniref:ferritin-like domain-containing protein n=1 Tax=Streptosporangium sp. NPDC048047 TaxID=3155748 RepID=UPI003413C0E5